MTLTETIRGDRCPECSYRMHPQGSCWVCVHCGFTPCSAGGGV